MAKDPGKARKVRTMSDDMALKQRMGYVMIRIPELIAELEKLKAERKTLREKLSAMRAAKKGGAEE
jgi:hypothetical protein